MRLFHFTNYYNFINILKSGKIIRSNPIKNNYQNSGIYIYPCFDNKDGIIQMMNQRGNTILEINKNVLYHYTWSGDMIQKNGLVHELQNNNPDDTPININLLKKNKPHLGEILVAKEELDISSYVKKVYIPKNMPRNWDNIIKTSSLSISHYSFKDLVDK